jgi:hypothetical protein
VLAVAPSAVYAFATGDPFSHTRFRFGGDRAAGRVS